MDRIQMIEEKIANDTTLFEEEIKYYISVAQNNPEKLYNIGELYYDGICVEQNYQKAIEYYKKAAELGSVDALKELGVMYGEGIGVEQDYKKAFEYYEQAAKRGNAVALNNLGYMYQHGEGVEQDFEKAKKLYEKAAEQGISGAVSNLGYMYYNGEGVEQDYKKAIELFEKATEQGNEIAKRSIMRYRYSNGERIEYAQLFFLEGEFHKNDSYYEKIKKRIGDGEEIISVKSLIDLTHIQIPKGCQDNNKIKDLIIKAILDFLNEKGDNTIINIRQVKDLRASVADDFYTVFDFKKIINIYKKILDCIDLNQNQEDIFMQIYIKLGLMISYDFDAALPGIREKRSVSRNLMVLLNKKGVCRGYAVILKNILDIVGIESNILHSRVVDDKTGHAFNQVKINGKWYYCDLTGDNTQIKKNEKMAFCLKSRESFVTDLFHEAMDKKQEHESNEDYSNVQRLFWKNKFKLFINNFRAPLEQLIEPAGIKEAGGRSI